PGYGSGWSAEIPNVLESVPACFARTTTVIVALLLNPRSPMAQLIIPPLFVHEPRVLTAETKSTAVLNLFVTVTCVAIAGPTFRTVTLYVRLLPTANGSGVSVAATERSFPGLIDTT